MSLHTSTEAPPLQALIFDVDGTLAELEDLHRRAFNEAFAAHGIGSVFPDPDRNWQWDVALYRLLLGISGGKERIAAYVRDWLGCDPDTEADRIAALHREKTGLYGKILEGEGVRLRPGIATLVADARDRGLRLAVATTTSVANVEALCRAAFGVPADALFDAIATGDQVAAKKPAPDVYRLALQRLGLPASACVALEDSANGLAAARGAGLRCVVSPSLYTEGEDFDAADLLLPGFDAVDGVAALERALAAATR